MRKVLVIASLLVLWNLPAFAQMEIAGGMGYMFPTSETENDLLGNYILGGNASYYLSDKFCVGGEIYYHKLDLTDLDIISLEEDERTDGKRSITNLTASAKYHFNSDSISLYGKFVFGSYEIKESWIEDDGWLSINSDKLPGYGIGLGVQFQSPGFFGAFIEGLYNQISLGDEYTLDSWNFVTVRAGILMKGY